MGTDRRSELGICLVIRVIRVIRGWSGLRLELATFSALAHSSPERVSPSLRGDGALVSSAASDAKDR